jgi:hypothetical protein
MRKYLGLFIVAAFVLVSVGMLARPAHTHAVDLLPECSGKFKDNTTCQDVNNKQTVSSNRLYGPNGLLTKAAGVIMFAGGVAAIIMIILGGFTFMTGSGDPGTLASARKTIIYAVVGLVILVLPSAIIRFVISRL